MEIACNSWPLPRNANAFINGCFIISGSIGSLFGIVFARTMRPSSDLKGRGMHFCLPRVRARGSATCCARICNGPASVAFALAHNACLHMAPSRLTHLNLVKVRRGWWSEGLDNAPREKHIDIPCQCRNRPFGRHFGRVQGCTTMQTGAVYGCKTPFFIFAIPPCQSWWNPILTHFQPPSRRPRMRTTWHHLLTTGP